MRGGSRLYLGLGTEGWRGRAGDEEERSREGSRKDAVRKKEGKEAATVRGDPEGREGM